MTYIITRKPIKLKKDKASVIPISWNVSAENILIELQVADSMVNSLTNSISIRVEDSTGQSFIQQGGFPLNEKRKYFTMDEHQLSWIPKRIKLIPIDFDAGILAVSVRII